MPGFTAVNEESVDTDAQVQVSYRPCRAHSIASGNLGAQRTCAASGGQSPSNGKDDYLGQRSSTLGAASMHALGPVPTAWAGHTCIARAQAPCPELAISCGIVCLTARNRAVYALCVP